MVEEPVKWRPGSFTKNFAWGKDAEGLRELHTVIRKGFGEKIEDVPREKFRERVSDIGARALIPINFFLFNKQIDGEDYLIVDELVFQALAWEHSKAFDRVALFAFLLSRVGIWHRASPDQARPAMWANAYVKEFVARKAKWNEKFIDVNSIEEFISNDPRYLGKTTRKLSTNLNYLLKIGDIQSFGQKGVSRWWVDCLFLALDRLSEERLRRKQNSPDLKIDQMLLSSDFFELTGGQTIEKELATRHLNRLYKAICGRERFSENAVQAKKRSLSSEYISGRPNDDNPRGALHFSNPKILKSIPAICTELALQAGFDVISHDQLSELSTDYFIREKTNAAIALLAEKGIKPTLTAEEVRKLTREK